MGGGPATLASAGWYSAEQLACGATAVSNDPIGPLSHSPGCREGGGRRKHISRGAVPFKPLYQSSSLRSRMMGPKRSTWLRLWLLHVRAHLRCRGDAAWLSFEESSVWTGLDLSTGATAPLCCGCVSEGSVSRLGSGQRH